jgi:hypothetical protein
LHGVFSGDHTSAFFNEWCQSPAVLIRKATFDRLGGFRADYRVPGALSELMSLAKLRNFKVETIPEPIVWLVEEYGRDRRLNLKAEPYRTIRPFLEMAPACLSRILMTRRTSVLLQQNDAGGSVSNTFNPITAVEAKARKVAAEAGGAPWLRNLGWKLYWFHIRIFRRLVETEIRVFKFILQIKKLFS